MAQFIYGALGVIGALMVIVLSGFCGWKLNDVYREKTQKVIQRELTLEEKKRAKEEAEAFATMLNYSADIAYGSRPNNEETAEE